MRLRILASNGRPIGEVGFWTGLYLLATLFAGVLFAFTDAYNLDWARGEVLGIFSEPWQDALSPPLQLVRLLAWGPFLIGLVATWRTLFSGVLKALRSTRVFSVRSPEHFSRLKLEDEISTFPNQKEGDFYDWIEQGREDERALAEAHRYGVVENPRIWRCNWPDLRDLPPESNLVDAVRTDYRGQKAAFEAARNRLTEAASTLPESDGPQMAFLVSPIQPAVTLAAEVLARDLRGVRIRTGYSTGPETVRAARIERQKSGHNATADQRSTKPNVAQTIVFAAPLSAFAMAPSDPRLPAPNEVFRPYCNVTNEPQEILTLRGRSVEPLGRRTLFYYENSTAEEVLARLALPVAYAVNLEGIDSYEDYRALLSGRTIGGGLRLKPGDSIVTWPPLTQAFLDAPGDQTYFDPLGFAKKERYQSRVFVFLDDRMFAPPTPSVIFAWRFVDTLIHLLLLEYLARRETRVGHLLPALTSERLRQMSTYFHPLKP